MKNKYSYNFTIAILFIILMFFILSLSNRNVKNVSVDKFLNKPIATEEEKKEFILKFLKNLDFETLEKIGIKQKDVVNESLSNYNINIIAKKTNDYYILLHNIDNNSEKEYITVFRRGLLTYKQIGSPIEFNNVIDVFLLPVNTQEKYIIFTRDLVGFKTSPLDLTSNLSAFIFDDKSNSFVEAINIVENAEEYVIDHVDEKSMYKKYRTKSDVMVTNTDYPIIEILTHYYEAVSQLVDGKIEGTPPYDLDFDVIKTSNDYNKYFYDSNFKHFLLGYLVINESNEVAGILRENSKIIDNNFRDTYTIIKQNGEIYEIFSDFTILKLN